jgi:hypothetical protein
MLVEKILALASPGLGYSTKYIRWHEWFLRPARIIITLIFANLIRGTLSAPASSPAVSLLLGLCNGRDL